MITEKDIIATKKEVIARIFGGKPPNKLDYNRHDNAFKTALAMAETRGLLAYGEKEFYLSYYS